MWFNQLMGFEEESPDQVRKNIAIEDKCLVSKINGQSYTFGQLEVAKLEDIRRRAEKLLKTSDQKIVVSEILADVKKLHTDPQNANAVFQAASQFNLLEMPQPYVTPESGVDGYEDDYTQGPACAIAAGAGTIFRNYFANVNGKIGQTSDHQIDCLEALGKALGNTNNELWKMQNGYAFATLTGLEKIHNTIEKIDEATYESLLGKLKIGIQWDTQVTISDCTHNVTQAYCSGLPIAYSNIPQNKWAQFAQLILNATYEATFYTGLLNYEKTGNPKIYLTLVGSGVFGNNINWIVDAIDRAISIFFHTPLEVSIVSYGRSNPNLQDLINKE